MNNSNVLNTTLFSFTEVWQHLVRDKKSLIVLLIILGINVHFLFKHSRLGTSPLSRFKTAECLLEHKTFEISKSAFPVSIDAIFVDGKFYSDKPPLYSVIMAVEAAPLYYMFNLKLSEHALFYEKYFLLINQVIPFVFMLLLAYHLMILVGIKGNFLALGIVALSLCNLTMAYTVSIINHAPTAVFCFIVFYLLAYSEIRNILLLHSKKWILILGLLLGLAISYEIYVVSILFCIAMYLWLKYRNIHQWLLFCAGVAFPVFIGLVLNVIITGNPLPFYFVKQYFHYTNSYWLNPVGFDALNDSYVKYFYNITFGHHGVFLLTPILLFSFLSIKNTPLKQVYLSYKMAAILTLILMVVFTNNYGGYALGFRFCVFLFPIFIFYCVNVLYEYRLNKVIVSVFLLLMLFSMLSVVEGLHADPLIRGTIDKLLLRKIQ